MPSCELHTLKYRAPSHICLRLIAAAAETDASRTGQMPLPKMVLVAELHLNKLENILFTCLRVFNTPQSSVIIRLGLRLRESHIAFRVRLRCFTNSFVQVAGRCFYIGKGTVILSRMSTDKRKKLKELRSYQRFRRSQVLFSQHVRYKYCGLVRI